MSDNVYEVLFNRILDITACIHIPLKSFAMYVVIRHTPQNLRHYSYFILNAMFWNFLCNFLFTFMHFYPLFPALCLRMNGISNLFIDSEIFSQSMFILMFFLVSECAFALLFAFPHRYIVFAHPKLASRIRPTLVFALCAAIHVLFALIYFPIAIGWTVSYDDYPNKTELPEKPFVFCFYPNGIRKLATILAYFLAMTIGSILLFSSSFLFLRSLKRLKIGIIHKDTFALQKKVFASLLMLTAIALFFAGIPIFTCIIVELFPYTLYGREASLISVVVLANYGSISAIAYLVFFKAYREAVKRIFSNFKRRFTGRNTKVRSIGLKC